MNITSEEYIKRLIELSDKKRILLQDMHILTQEQAEAIAAQDVKRLEELVENKQLKIDGINKLDEEFEVYQKRLKQTLGVSSLDEVQNMKIEGISCLKEIIGSIFAIMKEISELEQDNNLKAKEVLNALGEELKKINAGKKVNAAYNYSSNIGEPSYFIDRKK